MITRGDRLKIRKLVQEYWEGRVKEASFATLTQGKEVGHTIANIVDTETTRRLQQEFEARFQFDASGKKRERSMGDLWLLSGDTYNPTNVKTGVTGKGGQPNMVSLVKLISALFERQIDSYDLLLVKFALGSEIDVTVYLIDMLNHLEHMTFDAGPGQIMLRADAFFSAVSPQAIPSEDRPLVQKIDDLFALYEDGIRRLVQNRKVRLERLRRKRAEFARRGIRLPIDQSELRLR